MEQQKPWYRHLWVWLIMVPPLAAVIGGIATVVIAHRGADEVLADDFVKEGLALRADDRKRDAAAALGINATVHLQRDSGRVTVILRGVEAGRQPLTLRLVHPTNSRFDREQPLRPVGNAYQADLNQETSGRWGVQIEPEDKAWRLSGELAAEASAVTLGTGA